MDTTELSKQCAHKQMRMERLDSFNQVNFQLFCLAAWLLLPLLSVFGAEHCHSSYCHCIELLHPQKTVQIQKLARAVSIWHGPKWSAKITQQIGSQIKD